MAQNAPGQAHAFKRMMLLEMQEADERYRRDVQRAAEIWPVDLPPLSPAQKFKGRVRRSVRSLRTRVAMRVAPWLDEGY